MNRHKLVQSKYFQRLTRDWQHKFNISKAHSEYRINFINMLTQFSSMWHGHLGCISIARHRIELLPNSSPVHYASYQDFPTARKFFTPRDWKMFSQYVIEPAQIKWAAQIVFPPRKNGSLCFCNGYRKLNNLNRRDLYPISRKDKLIDSLGEEKVFSTLDAIRRYWQVKIEYEDQDKTAFCISPRPFYFYTIAVRFEERTRNVPKHNGDFPCKRWMVICFNLTRWHFIFSKTPVKHINHVKQVLMLLQRSGVMLKLI